MTDDYFVAPERFEGDGFVLRSYFPEDGARLAESVNDSHEHLKRFMVWSQPHTSLDEAEMLARQFRGRYLLAVDFVIGIFAPDEQELWGGTGFHLRGRPISANMAQIGMWIRASEAGRGLGSRALRGMLQWGFTAWPWQRLAWHCDSDNIVSAKTALSAGMRQEARLRGTRNNGQSDDLIFAMRRDEWQNAQS